MTTHHNRLNMGATRASSLLTPVVLSLRMQSQGKIATHEHLEAEIQLINEALNYAKLNPNDCIKLRLKLESYDAILIANGPNYQERKQTIQAYANDLCTASLQEQAA